jgi:hypothetical protein
LKRGPARVGRTGESAQAARRAPAISRAGSLITVFSRTLRLRDSRRTPCTSRVGIHKTRHRMGLGGAAAIGAGRTMAGSVPCPRSTRRRRREAARNTSDAAEPTSRRAGVQSHGAAAARSATPAGPGGAGTLSSIGRPGEKRPCHPERQRGSALPAGSRRRCRSLADARDDILSGSTRPRGSRSCWQLVVAGGTPADPGAAGEAARYR